MKFTTNLATGQNYGSMGVSVSSALLSGVTIGGWKALAWEEIESDWDYYSKAWHRSHGPKVTVTGRFVRFVSPSGKKVKTVEMTSWRGNWQAKALLASGLVKPQKSQMHVRLNSAMGIKKIGKEMGVTFYARTIKGELYDYCAVSPLGKVCHGTSPVECVRGLSNN